MVHKKQRGPLAPGGARSTKRPQLSTAQKVSGALYNIGRGFQTEGNYVEGASNVASVALPEVFGVTSAAGMGLRYAGKGLQALGNENRYAKENKFALTSDKGVRQSRNFRERANRSILGRAGQAAQLYDITKQSGQLGEAAAARLGANAEKGRQYGQALGGGSGAAFYRYTGAQHPKRQMKRDFKENVANAGVNVMSQI